MYIQISSGQGPLECQRVVQLLSKKLLAEHENLEIADMEEGGDKKCFRSITLLCNDDELAEELKAQWQGTVQWRGKSPFRPHHKRENWFVKVSFIEPVSSEVFDANQVKFEAFKGGGPGGQHVNKTSTAVRAVYLPTGDFSTCSDQRSQIQNRQMALLKLKLMIEEREEEKLRSQQADSRMLHYQLERGSPVKKLSGFL